MARTGRKPLPTSTKRRLGNPGHRPLNRREPIPPAVTSADLLAIPQDVENDADAVQFWQHYAPMLAQLQLLKALDVPKFTWACSEVGLFRKSLRVIQAEGEVYEGRQGPTIRPEVVLAQRHLKMACAILADFGFSPSDRARLVTGDAPTEDPLENLLRMRETGGGGPHAA
jgi:P27 family predicted phage terminase small subunit